MRQDSTRAKVEEGSLSSWRSEHGGKLQNSQVKCSYFIAWSFPFIGIS